MSRLSDLFRDPFVANAFRRADRDNGDSMMIPRDPRPLAPQDAEVAYVAAC